MKFIPFNLTKDVEKIFSMYKLKIRYTFPDEEEVQREHKYISHSLAEKRNVGLNDG